MTTEQSTLGVYALEQAQHYGLTEEQTQTLVAYASDPWRVNSEVPIKEVAQFMEWLNEIAFMARVKAKHPDLFCDDPLCSEHADPRDTSIDVVRLGAQG